MNNDILALASKLILASTTGDDKELQRVSEQLAAELTKEKTGDPSPALKKDFIGFLNFTNEEISKMPKLLRHAFRVEKHTVHYRKRIRGKNSCSYEARYFRDGYRISVSAPNLPALKERFIEKLHEIGDPNTQTQIAIPKNFYNFSMFWFENFHKMKTKENTYEHNLYLYNRHIKERFEKYEVKDVHATMLRKFLEEFSDRGKTADDLHNLFNQIFDCAIRHGLISVNPVNLFFHEKHEKEHGIAISINDERKLLEFYADTEYQLYFAVILYTGLRPNEYITATLHGDFIKAVNSKQHGKNKGILYKYIPITPMLRPYLQGITELKLPDHRRIIRRFKKVLPEHKPYDMRTTFQTRCDQCKIDDRAIGIFMGNSIGKDGDVKNNSKKLKDAYTDTRDPDYMKYLFEEGQKLLY